MIKEKAGNAEDGDLRDALIQHAPRPSAAHNEAVMAAASARAARTRRSRLIERNRTWSGVGLAAALVLAVGVWQLLPEPVDIDAVRGGGNAEILPADNATLDAPPAEFQWAEVSGVQRYQVTAYDSAAIQLWQSDWTEATSVSIPLSTRESMQPGVDYFWTVALEGNGSRRELGPYWYRIE